MSTKPDRSPWWRGLIDAARAPGIALGAALIGYGAQAATNGLDIPTMLAAAVLIWALPPMMAFTELYSAGASVSALIISIGLINVRALPMIVASLPLVHGGTGFRLWHLILAQVASPTSWAQMELMRGELTQHQRIPYFSGFCFILVSFGLIGALIGYLFVNDVPTALRLAALFLTPFFVLLMMGTAKRRPGQAAGICGAIGVPVCIDLIPDFGMIVGGVLFGTVGYVAGSLIRRLEERSQRS